MPDTAPSPALLSDDDLRETLDLLATAVASMSDRLDDQTRMLDRVNKTATEARSAAFAARKQTDPDRYGALVGDVLNGRIGDSVVKIYELAADLSDAAARTSHVLKDAEQDRSREWRQLREREQRLERSSKLLPWVGLGAVALTLALTVTLPRFSASNASICAVLGGSWTTTTTGEDVCVFYRR